MSVNCVPPGRTSPNQKGEEASANPASLKLVLRQAVVSGKEASLVPRKNRQVEFVLNSNAPCVVEVQRRSPRIIRRENTAAGYQIAGKVAASKLTQSGHGCRLVSGRLNHRLASAFAAACWNSRRTSLASLF